MRQVGACGRCGVALTSASRFHDMRHSGGRLLCGGCYVPREVPGPEAAHEGLVSGMYPWLQGSGESPIQRYFREEGIKPKKVPNDSHMLRMPDADPVQSGLDAMTARAKDRAAEKSPWGSTDEIREHNERVLRRMQERNESEKRTMPPPAVDWFGFRVQLGPPTEQQWARGVVPYYKKVVAVWTPRDVRSPLGSQFALIAERALECNYTDVTILGPALGETQKVVRILTVDPGGEVHRALLSCGCEVDATEMDIAVRIKPRPEVGVQWPHDCTRSA